MPAFIVQSFLTVTLLAALFSSKSQSADAKNTCLKIGYDETFAALSHKTNNHIREAYDAINVCITMIHVNLRRQTLLLRTGKLDGNLLRTLYYQKKNSDITVAVKEPTARIMPTLVSLLPLDKNCKPDDLKKIRVGYPMGTVWVENQLKNHTKALIPLPSMDDVPTLLARRRIDAFLFSHRMRFSLDKVLEDRGFNVYICQWPAISLHHILLKKHAATADRLSQALKIIKQRETRQSRGDAIPAQ